MDIIAKITERLNVNRKQIEAAVDLIDEGNTIPFIARYRKEATGSLDDEQLRELDEQLRYLRGLEERKTTVLSSIEEQGKLTDELRAKIEKCEVLVELEDLYRPYKPKKKTKASVARDKGLEPLAKIILEQKETEIEKTAEEYITDEVKTTSDAIDGAKDIIAEDIADVAEYRSYIRELAMQDGVLSSAAKNEKESSVYEMYYDFEERLDKLVSHNILAINRGEKEGILAVKINLPVEKFYGYIAHNIITTDNESVKTLLEETIKDSYDRLIEPSIIREIRSKLTEKAEESAIKVFSKNLEQLLMQPPITGKVVLGWDPAFRTGCKLAVVDATGKVLDTTVIYPTMPQNRVKEAKEVLRRLIDKYDVSLISLGNGTASRESEQVIAELIKEIEKPVQYVIVSEAGASVYSASKLASEEFPEFDVGQRSAASIARRLQDPLAELVKIDPKSIGVGQYQHDCDQKKLSMTLGNVVEDSVNRVGVDLNTASAPLLSYISGISATVAKNIVEYRENNGRYKNRKELLKVSKLGPKAFEQSAGFMRIFDGDNPLDATAVHPESYDAVLKLLETLNIDINNLNTIRKEAEKKAKPAANSIDKRHKNSRKKEIKVKNTGTNMAAALKSAIGKSPLSDRQTAVSETIPVEKSPNTSHSIFHIRDKENLAETLGIGVPTLEDILKELEKPSRDPRESMPLPILRSDIMEMKDLKEGMILKGTVRNIVDFGAFVDIGVHEDGLVHISAITDKFIKHPLEVLKLGDVVTVKVISVDMAKKRIGLSMKTKD